MTTSATRLIATLATAASLMTASAAFAKNGNGGNQNHSIHSSALKFNLGGNSQKVKSFKSDNYSCHKPCYDGHCYSNYKCYSNYCYPSYGCYSYYGCVHPVYGCQAYEPFHCNYYVLPGDSCYTISLKEYGTSSNANYIAQYNRLPINAALVPGQQLMLPSISAIGTLGASNAPAAMADFTGTIGTAFSAPVNTTPSFAMPASFTSPASITAPAVEQPRTKIAVGSTLLVDGQAFGDKPGVARLRVSGLSLPVEVLEWSTGSVKIRLPQVELASATVGDIEVLRADGSLASRTAVELTTANAQLAFGK